MPKPSARLQLFQAIMAAATKRCLSSDGGLGRGKHGAQVSSRMCRASKSGGHLFLWYPSAGRCRLQLGHRLPCRATEAACSGLIADDPLLLLIPPLECALRCIQAAEVCGENWVTEWVTSLKARVAAPPSR